MPLPMVHLNVAQTVKNTKKLKIQNIADYYLGSISPDAIHMKDNFTPKDKENSHLNARRNESIDNVKKFITTVGIKNDFILGYIVHVLTDIYWHESLYQVFKTNYSEDKNPIQDQRHAYYSDTDQLDIMLYDQPNRLVFWNYLNQAHAQSIKNIISAEEVDKWNKRTLNWYEEKHDYQVPIRYISLVDLNKFISSASKFINQFLVDYEVIS